jgi:4-hydroxy-2-oxoheptanedioate aldolase
MRESRVRTIWNEGGAVVNGWLAIANSFSAEVMASAPFDSITVDTQHGMVDFEGAVAMFGALSGYPPTPLARVSWNDPAATMKLLDAGAYGIRSFGPARGLLYGGPDYASEANRTIFTMAMIETREALDNLDDIMSVEGLDAVYVGPNDLGLSLGHAPTPEPTAPEVREAIDTICAAADRHGVVAGIHVMSGESARRRIDQGFRFVSLANDARLMAAAANAEIKAARGEQ